MYIARFVIDLRWIFLITVKIWYSNVHIFCFALFSGYTATLGSHYGKVECNEEYGNRQIPLAKV